MLQELNTATMGWLQYFHLAAIKGHLRALDEWIRRRIRCFIWKQWKTWRNRVNQLLAAGIGPWLAYGITSGKHGLWKVAGSPALTRTLPNAKLTELRSEVSWRGISRFQLIEPPDADPHGISPNDADFPSTPGTLAYRASTQVWLYRYSLVV